MKLDEQRGLIDGSSIAEETLATRSASRFTETTDASVVQDGKSSHDSRKLSMDTEDNLNLVPQMYPDFAKSGATQRVGAQSSLHLDQSRSGKRSQSSTINKYFEKIGTKNSEKTYESRNSIKGFSNLKVDQIPGSKDLFCEFSLEDSPANF